MRFAILLSACFAAAVSSAFAAPLAGSSPLLKKQYIDEGATPPVNCSSTPSGCPADGPSGTLNYPNDGATLTTFWNNAGFVDVSYTPVNQAVGAGWIQTTSVIFTLRQFYYGVPAFSDSIIILGALGVPYDFSTFMARLSLPARFYDGDSNPENDVTLGSQGSSSVGEWAFQVIEQQEYTKGDGSPSTLIEFMSAAPLVNITYVALGQ